MCFKEILHNSEVYLGAYIDKNERLSSGAIGL